MESGFGVTKPVNSVANHSGISGVFDIAGVGVMDGVREIVGVSVIVCVIVMVGVSVTVGEGGKTRYTAGSA